MSQHSPRRECRVPHTVTQPWQELHRKTPCPPRGVPAKKKKKKRGVPAVSIWTTADIPTHAQPRIPPCHANPLAKQWGGWVGAVIKVQSTQKQSRASGSSSLLCLRAYHKKTQKGEESAVCGVPQCSLEIARPEEGHSSTEKAQLQSSYSHCCHGDRR